MPARLPAPPFKGPTPNRRRQLTINGRLTVVVHKPFLGFLLLLLLFLSLFLLPTTTARFLLPPAAATATVFLSV